MAMDIEHIYIYIYICKFGSLLYTDTVQTVDTVTQTVIPTLAKYVQTVETVKERFLEELATKFVRGATFFKKLNLKLVTSRPESDSLVSQLDVWGGVRHTFMTLWPVAVSRTHLITDGLKVLQQR